MRKEDFYCTLNKIEDKYILEAKKETKKRIQLCGKDTLCSGQPDHAGANDYGNSWIYVRNRRNGTRSKNLW